VFYFKVTIKLASKKQNKNKKQTQSWINIIEGDSGYGQLL
jgi:hypothetical protein